MTPGRLVRLDDRAVIAVTGPDARAFLDNLVTNDMDRLAADGDALHAALLTPQGKILFEFFVIQHRDGFLLEAAAAGIEALVKRLSMYRLRANVEIVAATSQYAIVCDRRDASAGAAPADSIVAFRDPRHDALGRRLIVPRNTGPAAASADLAACHDHRIRLAIADAGSDYPLGDTFPHEANLDRTGSVDFRKGCFVGQEVVSRMQHKALVRKRVARIDAAAGGLASGGEVRVGDVAIGTVGSVTSDGQTALALLRLDRVAEAIDKGLPVTACGTAISVDPDLLDRYRTSAAAREARS